MKFDFNAKMKQVEKEYNLGKGEYFKVKEGDNKVRLVSACLPHPGEYQGKPNFKWLCQVLDLSDGKVKPYFMPHKVYQNICSLQQDEDYKFEEVPMPYNINIRADNAGKVEVKYSVIPSPKRIDLTPEQLEAISKAPTVEELQQKIWDSDKNPKTQEPVQEEANIEAIAENIPF